MLPVNTMNGLIVAGGLFVGGAFGYSGVKDLREPQGARLELAQLEFKEGRIYQHVEVTGRDVIIADWSASIFVDGRIVCSGGGTSPYRGEPVSFTPDQWTGDDCGEIPPDAQGTGAWEWKNEKGVLLSITKTIKLE